MKTTNDLGKTGEQIAIQYLVEQGYAILDTNWRVGKVEADIIAHKEGWIVFVEVKTRTDNRLSRPEEAVNSKKQKAYIRLANAYILQKQLAEEVRFDIIAIVIRSLSDIEIQHIPNAYTTVG